MAAHSALAGAGTRTWTHGDIRVVATYPGDDGEAVEIMKSTVAVYWKGRKTAVVDFKEIMGAPEVFFAEMDPGNAQPEVVIEGYSGGAHCCEMIRAVSAPPGGASGPWRVIGLGEHDGATAKPKDLDGDGLAEILVEDDNFLYAYGCYACSYAPPLILGVRDGRRVNLTRQPAFRPLLKKEKARIAKMLKKARRNREPLNGYLAGYVALGLLLGEGPKTWRYMLRHASPQALDWCPLEEDGEGRCPVPRMKISFPMHLSIFLRDLGYIGKTK